MSNNNFVKILKDKKLKITPQRIAILEELDKHGHSSVDDIFSLIKTRIPSVSLATIYKNILAMQNVDILKSVKTPTQKQKYEINKIPHIHLFCKVCDNLEDFEIDTINFQKYCELKSGYSDINDASILLIGICKNCQNNQKAV
ncbi:Fur family transcriptional regulator [Helicobacter sp. MIT 14-3879]|uniref:Fur family transcriptional regulator n=1 Tax=Helicobacter sp. MIT 14-3879 TaxID=2040649 RepID=UPI000E1F7FD0|nr:transcriptional repressor [Helicobacter sp. MIT 14-3879]RDU62638.1 transcriptional repressor [Helicobacter sp. MIT 14-3879]